MAYYKLPTKKRQVAITLAILVVYGVLFYFLKTGFPEFSQNFKRFLSQYGLFVIFASAVLAGLSFFGSSKTHHDKSLADREIDISNKYLEILREQEEQLGIDLSAPIRQNKEKKDLAQQRLEDIKAHPEYIRFCGLFSIFVLAIGTLMCVVGAG